MMSRREMFPDSLNRLQYLARFAVFLGIIILFTFLVSLFLPDHSGERVHELGNVLSGGFFLLFFLGMLIAKILLMDIPRLNNIGWPSWCLFLLLIPGINTILQLGLFFVPTDTGRK